MYMGLELATGQGWTAAFIANADYQRTTLAIYLSNSRKFWRYWFSIGYGTANIKEEVLGATENYKRDIYVARLGTGPQVLLFGFLAPYAGILLKGAVSAGEESTAIGGGLGLEAGLRLFPLKEIQIQLSASAATLVVTGDLSAALGIMYKF